MSQKAAATKSSAAPAPAVSEIAWRRETEPRTARPPASWRAEVVAQGFRANLTLNLLFGPSWMWQVHFVPPQLDGMILTGQSPSFEAAQEDAQAVVRLYAESRPLYMDRRPVYSVAAPTEPKPAPAGHLTFENRRRTSFVLRNAAELESILARLDKVKHAASRLSDDPGNEEAREALRFVKYLLGESNWIALLEDYEHLEKPAAPADGVGVRGARTPKNGAARD